MIQDDVGSNKKWIFFYNQQLVQCSYIEVDSRSQRYKALLKEN